MGIMCSKDRKKGFLRNVMMAKTTYESEDTISAISRAKSHTGKSATDDSSEVARTAGGPPAFSGLNPSRLRDISGHR